MLPMNGGMGNRFTTAANKVLPMKQSLDEVVINILEALRYAVKNTNLDRIEGRIRMALAGIQKIRSGKEIEEAKEVNIFIPQVSEMPTQKEVVLLGIEKYFGEDRTIFSIKDLASKIKLHPGWSEPRSEGLISANVGHLEKQGHVIKTGKFQGRNHYKLTALGREYIRDIERRLLEWKG